MVKRLWERTRGCLLIAATLAPFLGCRPSQPKESRQVVPQLELDGVRFRVYRDAALRAEGEAARVTFRRDSTDVQAQDLVATLERAEAPVEIRAPEAHGVLSDRTFAASGGVEARREGDVARTARARFEPNVGAQGIVRGDDPVTVTGPNRRLDGKNFTLDPATGELDMRGGVHFVSGGGDAR